MNNIYSDDYELIHQRIGAYTELQLFSLWGFYGIIYCNYGDHLTNITAEDNAEYLERLNNLC